LNNVQGDTDLVNTPMEQSAERVPFQQAGIAVEKPEEYEQLRSAVARVFAAERIEKFLRLLRHHGIPIRDFHRVLRATLLEQAYPEFAKSGQSAQRLYGALTVADQAQMREFYLTALEAVDQPLREKYNKLYRYY
jgi:hypothetical protein